MSSSASSKDSRNSYAKQASSPTSAPTGTGTTPSKVNHQDASMELKNMASGSESVKGAIPLGEDIMQVARIGEVSVMQRLFDTKKFNAGYKDDEGITPLHVRYYIFICFVPNFD